MEVLVEAVASGDDGIEEQSGIGGKYPDAALAAITQGFAKSKSDWTRMYLVDACGTLKGNVALFLTGTTEQRTFDRYPRRRGQGAG